MRTWTESKVSILLSIIFYLAGRKGRDPSPDFSTSYYLNANPDLRETGINPLLHYIQEGKAEKRLPKHPGGEIVSFLADVPPLETMVKIWRSQEVPTKIIDSDLLYSEINSMLAEGFGSLMISISHDNYRTNSGGVQYCIQREEEIASERLTIYLNLSPYYKFLVSRMKAKMLMFSSWYCSVGRKLEWHR